MSCGILESHVTCSLKDNASCVHIFFFFTSEKGTQVKSAILKRARDRKAYWMVKKGLESQSKNHLRSSAVEGVGQSSTDKWKSSKNRDKWKEVSLEMEVLGRFEREDTHLEQELQGKRHKRIKIDCDRNPSKRPKTRGQ